MPFTSAVVDRFRARGAARLAYCHCDHFEPWRSKPRTISAENAALVERFAQVTGTIEEARRLTLFYRPHVKPVLLPRADARAVEGDGFGLMPLSSADHAITSPAIRSLVEAGHELQVHVHHERVTFNRRYAAEAPWAADLSAHRERDELRLRNLIELSLEIIRAESGLPLDEWLLVHGNWALAASDPDVCQVDTELEVLRSLGCVGDFTFTGEPRHDATNPAVSQPAVISPARGRKAFDIAARPAFGAGRPAVDEHLFMWSSPRGRIASALDYRNPEVERRLHDPTRWAQELAGGALKLGDTLYVMTYAHSMSMQHGSLGAMTFPHEHAAIRRMLGTLFDSAAAAGLEVDFLAASEVMDRVLEG